jgi:hypothetical protein
MDDTASYLTATSKAFGLEVIPSRTTEHDILSVFFAGKTKRGYGESVSRYLLWLILGLMSNRGMEEHIENERKMWTDTEKIERHMQRQTDRHASRYFKAKNMG